MVQVLQGQDHWGDAFRQAGSNLVSGYHKRSDEMALQKAIGDLGDKPTPRQILDAVTKTKTHSNEAKQGLLKNALGVANFEELQTQHREANELAKKNIEVAQAKADIDNQKQSQERERTRRIANQLDVPEEKRKELGDTLSLSAAEGLYKDQVKSGNKGEKPSPFDKKLQEKNAEEYIGLTKEIPVLESNAKNIDDVEKLSKDLGWRGRLNILGEKAAELNALSFPLIQPIVKMFNPSGPIATRKLEVIQDKYQIKKTDTPAQAQGKINALRAFNNQAIQRAKERLALLEEFKGNPPKQVIEKFDKDSETLGDAMVDYETAGEAVDIPGIPEAKTLKGVTIKGPDGTRYTSDGTRWLKK